MQLQSYAFHFDLVEMDKILRQLLRAACKSLYTTNMTFLYMVDFASKKTLLAHGWIDEIIDIFAKPI
jgi:hypothetical protein